jgi:hypothetical protein
LPYTNFSTFGALAESGLGFTLTALEQYITSHKYEENATIAMMKYGDGFAKIAGQIAPLLRSMQLADDNHTIRAAKILVMNNMEINNKNLTKIKDMDAKIQDVQTKLHPRIAAQMVAEGFNPANMHMDDILNYIEQFNEKYGTSDNEELLKNIARMDKEGDINPETRQQVMEIYRMLHKVSKNGGAGIGYAVNAGVEMTLENLMDFSKNFNQSAARRNIINYTAQDGVYYAKHLVSSFIADAKPKPLAAFVQQESLNDPLAQSVAKLNKIAKALNADGIDALEKELSIERVNAAMKELSGTGRETLRSLAALGLPVTVANLRQFKAVKDKRLEKETPIEEVLDTLPNSGEISKIDPTKANEDLTEKIENLIDQAFETPEAARKISQIDVILQNLAFRKMLLTSDRDYSFAMNFSGRPAEVKLHLLSDNINIEQGVSVYLSINTAMGEIEGLLKLKDQTAEITIAAENKALPLIRQNRGLLTDLLTQAGIKDVNFGFVDKNALKMQLSRSPNQPIY